MKWIGEMPQSVHPGRPFNYNHTAKEKNANALPKRLDPVQIQISSQSMKVSNFRSRR